jgi:hypothetical protein
LCHGQRFHAKRWHDICIFRRGFARLPSWPRSTTKPAFGSLLRWRPKRVAYGLSEARLKTITGSHAENPTLDLPCRTVFAAGQRKIEVVGPLLEVEAAAQHAGVWD